MNCPAPNTELVAVETAFSCAGLATGRLEAPTEKGGVEGIIFCMFIVFSIINLKKSFSSKMMAHIFIYIFVF